MQPNGTQFPLRLNGRPPRLVLINLNWKSKEQWWKSFWLTKLFKTQTFNQIFLFLGFFLVVRLTWTGLGIVKAIYADVDHSITVITVIQGWLSKTVIKIFIAWINMNLVQIDEIKRMSYFFISRLGKVTLEKSNLVDTPILLVKVDNTRDIHNWSIKRIC